MLHVCDALMFLWLWRQNYIIKSGIEIRTTLKVLKVRRSSDMEDISFRCESLLAIIGYKVIYVSFCASTDRKARSVTAGMRGMFPKFT